MKIYYNSNIIHDEKENYYLIRALNMADIADIENKITIDENGKIIKIRTDVERAGENAKYYNSIEPTLEEVYDHIKKDYLKETNCISLSNDPEISLKYGKNYKDKYVLVKIDKKDSNVLEYVNFNNKIDKQPKTYIFNATIFLINEIEKKLKHNLKNIDKSNYTKIIDEIENNKKSNNINKIIVKLNFLEQNNLLYPMIQKTTNNFDLFDTIERAYNSNEFIHYGSIGKNEIVEISKEDLEKLIQNNVCSLK